MTPIKNYFLNMGNMGNLVRRIINIQKDNKTIAYKTDLLPLEECELSEEETDQDKAEFKLMTEHLDIYDYESAFHKLKDICFNQPCEIMATNKKKATILKFFEGCDTLLQNKRQQNIRRLSIAINSKNQELQDSNNPEINIQ